MPRPKSLLTTMRIDEAKSSHNCQNNSRHRIKKGDKRLKVSNGRSHDHYCVDCAIAFINRDVVTLQSLLQDLEPTV